MIQAMVEAQFKGWNLDEVLKDPWYVKCDHGAWRERQRTLGQWKNYQRY